jgi:hypothetical protein
LLTTVETFTGESDGKCDIARAASALGDNLDIQSTLRSSDLESPWDAASVWRAKESTMAQANFIMRIVHFIEDKVRRTIAILSLSTVILQKARMLILTLIFICAELYYLY